MYFRKEFVELDHYYDLSDQSDDSYDEGFTPEECEFSVFSFHHPITDTMWFLASDLEAFFKLNAEEIYPKINGQYKMRWSELEATLPLPLKLNPDDIPTCFKPNSILFDGYVGLDDFLESSTMKRKFVHFFISEIGLLYNEKAEVQHLEPFGASTIFSDVEIKYQALYDRTTELLWFSGIDCAKSLKYDDAENAVFLLPQDYKLTWSKLSDGLFVDKDDKPNPSFFPPYWHDNIIMINVDGANKLIRDSAIPENYKDELCTLVIESQNHYIKLGKTGRNY